MIIREEIDQPQKTAKKGSIDMLKPTADPARTVKLDKPAAPLRFAPPGDCVRLGGPPPPAMTPETEDSMSVTNFRVVTNHDFADALGLCDEGHDRHPHSPVKQGVVKFYNVEGALLGQIRLAWTADGYCIPETFMLPCAATAALAAVGEPWL